jgi:hypothetical protein
MGSSVVNLRTCYWFKSGSRWLNSKPHNLIHYGYLAEAPPNSVTEGLLWFVRADFPLSTGPVRQDTDVNLIWSPPSGGFATNALTVTPSGNWAAWSLYMPLLAAQRFRLSCTDHDQFVPMDSAFSLTWKNVAGLYSILYTSSDKNWTHFLQFQIGSEVAYMVANEFAHPDCNKALVEFDTDLAKATTAPPSP